MVIFLFLSLLAAISCSATKSPCDATMELVPADDKLEYIDNYCGSDCDQFNCGNDTLIYSPKSSNRKDYKVELLSLKCNTTTQKWIAEEGYRNLTGKREIYEGGTIQCKGNIKMSCSETRLEFNTIHRPHSEDPTIDKRTTKGIPKSYKCPPPKHPDSEELHFFYSLKFSFRPTEGYYLMESPQCDEGTSELTAKFAGNSSNVRIPYYGLITCKEFSCRDSNDLPLTWLRILKVETECLSWADCIKPSFENTQFPCGQEGHELVVYRKKGTDEQFIWLKDHFLLCSDRQTIHFVDTEGERVQLEKTDRVICRRPPSCDQLMSDSDGEYGCMDRSSCESIDSSLIPHSHLSSFDGRCTLREHTLTIVGGETSASPGWELSSISCKYGKWHAIRAEEARNVEPIPAINKKTNFVCEGRADFQLDQCDDPQLDCEVKVLNGTKGISKDICMAATKNASGTSIHCHDPKFHLVLRTKYNNGDTEKITRVVGDMTCDRRSRNWMSANRPFLEARSTIETESSFVCAFDACSSVPLTSICTNETYCKPVEPPKYWLNARCKDSSLYLLYSRKQRQTPEEISDLHCEVTPADKKAYWSFKVNGNNREAENEDNFYCSVYKSWSDQQKAEKKKKDYLEDTSPGCSPTKIDSICFINQEKCLIAVKREKKVKVDETKGEEETHFVWECEKDRRMWYFAPSAKKIEEGIEVDFLNCTPKHPFWRATKFNTSSIFIPQPHSNFLCFSVEQKGGSSLSESAPSNNDEKKKSGKKWKWPWTVGQSILIFTSLLIIIFSIVIVVWSTVKHRKVLEEREKLK